MDLAPAALMPHAAVAAIASFQLLWSTPLLTIAGGYQAITEQMSESLGQGWCSMDVGDRELSLTAHFLNRKIVKFRS